MDGFVTGGIAITTRGIKKSTGDRIGHCGPKANATSPETGIHTEQLACSHDECN